MSPAFVFYYRASRFCSDGANDSSDGAKFCSFGANDPSVGAKLCCLRANDPSLRAKLCSNGANHSSMGGKIVKKNKAIFLFLSSLDTPITEKFL